MLSSCRTWGFYFQLPFISWFWWAEVLRSESKYLHLSLFLSVFLSCVWWEQSRAQVADWDVGCQVEHRPGAPTGVTPRVSPHGCHPTGVIPGFGRDGLERCRAKATMRVMCQALKACQSVCSEANGRERVPAQY